MNTATNPIPDPTKAQTTPFPRDQYLPSQIARGLEVDRQARINSISRDPMNAPLNHSATQVELDDRITDLEFADDTTQIFIDELNEDNASAHAKLHGAIDESAERTAQSQVEIAEVQDEVNGDQERRTFADNVIIEGLCITVGQMQRDLKAQAQVIRALCITLHENNITVCKPDIHEA